VRDVPAGADVDSRRVERKNQKVTKKDKRRERESKCESEKKGGKERVYAYTLSPT